VRPLSEKLLSDCIAKQSLAILAKARLVNSKKELKILTLDLGIGSLFVVQSLDQFIPVISSLFASNLVKFNCLKTMERK
jgi:hypothetical protein